MTVFGYTCELITQLKPKQQEMCTYSIMQTLFQSWYLVVGACAVPAGTRPW